MTTTKLYIYRKESIIIKIKLVALITILPIHLIMLKILYYIIYFCLVSINNITNSNKKYHTCKIMKHKIIAGKFVLFYSIPFFLFYWIYTIKHTNISFISLVDFLLLPTRIPTTRVISVPVSLSSCHFISVFFESLTRPMTRLISNNIDVK